VPAGAPLADSKRLVVLRNFANLNGDLEATARTLRVAVAEVRAELQALLERRGADSRPGSPEDRAPRPSDGDADAPDRGSPDRGSPDHDGAGEVPPAANGSSQPARGGATRADASGSPPPPVVLPAGAATPGGKAPKPPARARRGA
jgi:hypothetical protein